MLELEPSKWHGAEVAVIIELLVQIFAPCKRILHPYPCHSGQRILSHILTLCLAMWLALALRKFVNLTREALKYACSQDMPSCVAVICHDKNNPRTAAAPSVWVLEWVSRNRPYALGSRWSKENERHVKHTWTQPGLEPETRWLKVQLTYRPMSMTMCGYCFKLLSGFCFVLVLV